MLDKLFDALHWATQSVSRFEMQHWVICFGVLMLVGFLCMRGLGVRGAR